MEEEKGRENALAKSVAALSEAAAAKEVARVEALKVSNWCTCTCMFETSSESRLVML